MSEVKTEPDGITPLALLQEWVFELGLPSWDQTEGKLRDGLAVLNDDTGAIEESAAYCCLGVLCELGTRHGLVERSDNRYRWRGDAVLHGLGSPSWNDGVLPEDFAEWLGIVKDPKVAESCPKHEDQNCPDGYRCDYRNMETLSGLNDAGHPFTFIRDRIQAQIVAPREAEEVAT